MTHKPVLKEGAANVPTHLEGRFHTDMWGPSLVNPLVKSILYQFTDDKTHCIQVYILTLKSEALKAYLSFEAWMKTQYRTRIKWLCSDFSGEYCHDPFPEAKSHLVIPTLSPLGLLHHPFLGLPNLH